MPGKNKNSASDGSGKKNISPAPPQQDENVQLMLKFQAGDTSAFDELVKRNVNTVHALVFRFLSDPSQTEDITQEVFMRVFRNAANYKPTAKFSTWLYRIVANLCFNVMRASKKNRHLSLDPAGSEDSRIDVPDQVNLTPDEEMSRQELRLQVKQAVDNLPENQRVAIILNKYENKSYEEIAQVLSTTTMAVKSLLSRARANLKDSLGRSLKHK